ncbi:hypothetical protein LguiA_030135 [Lonicera macranthoides]
MEMEVVQVDFPTPHPGSKHGNSFYFPSPWLTNRCISVLGSVPTVYLQFGYASVPGTKFVSFLIAENTRSISKLWHSLISGQQFAKTHLKLLAKNNEYARHRLILSSTCPPSDLRSCSLYSGDPKFWWNPSTRQSRRLPNPALHWPAISDFNSGSAYLWRFVALDLANEIYGEVQPTVNSMRVLLGELICVICNYYETRAYVCVMKGYGVRESWTKLLTFKHLIDRDDSFTDPQLHSFVTFLEAESVVSPNIHPGPERRQ